MNSLERDLQIINGYHECVQKFFYASVPGAIWTLYQLTLGGLGEKLINSLQTNVAQVTPSEMIFLAVSFAVWLYPFEYAEQNMVRLKQSVRDYRIRSGDENLPITYTPVDYIVNTVMKFAFEKSPMP